jgi:hypothetical protein
MALAEKNGVDRERVMSILSSSIFDCLIYKVRACAKKIFLSWKGCVFAASECMIVNLLWGRRSVPFR